MHLYAFFSIKSFWFVILYTYQNAFNAVLWGKRAQRSKASCFDFNGFMYCKRLLYAILDTIYMKNVSGKTSSYEAFVFDTRKYCSTAERDCLHGNWWLLLWWRQARRWVFFSGVTGLGYIWGHFSFFLLWCKFWRRRNCFCFCFSFWLNSLDSTLIELSINVQ